MYIQEINNEIKELSELPKQYVFADGSRTGSFHLMDAAILEAEGFFPVEITAANYDPLKEYVVPQYTKNGNKYIKSYAKVAIDIDMIKERKISEIQNHFSSLIESFTIDYKSTQFTINQETLNNITELQSLVSITGQFPNPFSWTDATGQEVAFTQAEFNNFVQIAGIQKLSYVSTVKTHVATVKALQTVDEILDYKYMGGVD